MKLFQQLLVAPAALGLIAPIAETAAELNVNGVSEYSNNGDVQSFSQFTDVYPTDWAHQALTDMAKRHGCTAARPNGSITRYEAAALLNECLGNVAQANEEAFLLGEEIEETETIDISSSALNDAKQDLAISNFSGEEILLLDTDQKDKGKAKNNNDKAIKPNNSTGS